MRKLNLNLIVLFIAVLASAICGCKKEAANNTDDSIASIDALNIANAMNSTLEDADNAMSTNQTISGKTQGLVFETLCGGTAIVDSTNGTATITYDGEDCFGYLSCTGTISIQLQNFPAAHWAYSQATLALNYNVTVTILATNLTYTITGTHYVTNISGGLTWQMMDGVSTTGSMYHKHRCNNVNITFPDGSLRAWNFNRTMIFGNPFGNNGYISIGGDTTVNGFSGVAQWGTDRLGDTLSSCFGPTSDYACGFFHPISGKYVNYIANRTATVNYGVNSNGTSYTGNGCAYGYQMTYTKGNSTITTVFPY